MRKYTLIMIAVLFTVAAGCPGNLGRPTPPSDNGGSFDGPTSWGDIGPRPDGSGGGGDSGGTSSDAGGKLACNGDCYDYVMNRILLPVSSTQSNAYGYKKGGQIYNAFGDLMVLIGSQASSLNMQEDVDLSVYQGKTLILMRVKAKSLSSAPSAKAQAWLGDTMSCCTSSSVSACKSEAKSKCFSGSTALDVSKSSPKDMIFPGSISGSKFSFGPSKLILPLDIKGMGKISLSLVAASVSGTVSASGVTSGVLSGAIPKTDMDTKLIPGLAAMLDKEYKDASTPKSTKDLLKSLLDTNKDGSITAAELKSNVLLGSLLAGDVDADGDGSKDFSLGLGFTAVGCVIVGAGT